MWCKMQRVYGQLLSMPKLWQKRDLVSTEFAQRLTDGKGLDRN